LTLTAYNPELSNAPFPLKQQHFANSHLELNRYFQNASQWTRAEIEARSQVLADMALTVWPYFGDNQSLQLANVDTVTGKTPRVLTILGQQMSVESWRGVLKQTLGTIADLEPDLFEVLAREYSRFISLDAGRFRSPHQLSNGFFIELNLSAKDIYRFCAQAIESIGLSGENWIVETE
jgi:hypothetical protein